MAVVAGVDRRPAHVALDAIHLSVQSKLGILLGGTTADAHQEPENSLALRGGKPLAAHPGFPSFLHQHLLMDVLVLIVAGAALLTAADGEKHHRQRRQASQAPCYSEILGPLPY